MAIRFDAANDRLSSTASMPTGTAYSVLLWAKIVTSTATGTFQIFFTLNNGSRIIYVETDGMALDLNSSGTTAGTGDAGGLRTLALNTWYRIGLVVNGTAMLLYHGTETGALTASAPGTAPPDQLIPTSINIGVDLNSAFLRGDLANFKMYGAALTAAEVEAEFAQVMPIRTANLLRWHPFMASELVDYSGNGATLTSAGGATTTSDHPPTRYARSRGPRVKLSPPPDIIRDLDAIDVSVLIQTPELDKLADLDLVTITADLTSIAEVDKTADIDILQNISVETPTAIASKHVVVRPPLYTAATVELPAPTVEITSDVTVDLDIVEVNVSLIANPVELEKVADLDLVTSTITTQDPEIDHATRAPADPQFINVEPLAVKTIKTSFGVQNIQAAQVIPQDLELARVYNLAPIDITIFPFEAETEREISLDPVEITTELTFTTVSQTSYRLNVVDAATVEIPDVDVAIADDLDNPAISVFNEDQPVRVQHVISLPVVDISVLNNTVVTYQSHRVGIVEINPISQEPELAKLSDVELISIFTRLDGQAPDLAHIFDIATSRLITVTPPPVSSQGFNDDPIEVEVELLPVDVGFSVEDFSYVQGIRVEPFLEPARVIAQDIRTKKFLHWELPISDLTIDYNLSGPVVISGNFGNEILDLQDLGLEANATWIHVEEGGFIRASGILQPTSVDEDETLTLEAVGPSAYPTGQPYDNKFEGINLDPADIIRVIWGHLQSYSDAKLGVVVRGNTPVKLGKPLPPAPPDPLPEGYVDPNPNDNNDKPYSLVWWEAPDCGSEISKLITETPMDYVEVSSWNADKTDVLHFIDLGFPRCGRRRDDLSFVQEENLIRSIGPEELEGFWASNVILMGKGEGSSIIKGYAALPNPTRIRKTYILNDPTCDNVPRANKLAMQELMRRQAILDIKEIEADARHDNARLGAFQLGDDVLVRGRIPWANTGNGDGEVYIWSRILGFTYTPENESLRVRLRRSESFSYGSGATS